jgi:hypothetical protein
MCRGREAVMKREDQHRLVIDGNAFYELDLNCVKNRQGKKCGQKTGNAMSKNRRADETKNKN